MVLERVSITEVNNTKYIRPLPNVLSDLFLGYFKKGQAFKPYSITDEADLILNFGEPVATGAETNQIDFYTVLDVLKFISPLIVMRTVSATGARNATLFVKTGSTTAGDVANYVKRYNDDITPVIYNAGANVFETIIYCAYPAVDGNNIKVALHTTPGTSSGIGGKTFGEIFSGIALGANQMYCVIGTTSEVYEKFIISKSTAGKDENGNNIFIDEALKKSNYIRSYSNPNALGIIAPGNFTAASLAGGNSAPLDQSTEIAAFVANGLDQFLNKESYDIHLIIDKHTNTDTAKAKLIDLAAKRGDAAVIIAPNISTALLSDPMHLNADVDSYYSAMISAVDGAVGAAAYMCHGISCLNFKLQKDKYNDVYFVNSYAGEVAGTITASNIRNGFGEPVAGLSNGQILSTDIMLKKWSEDDRKTFATYRLNPIIKMAKYSDYPILFDCLTMLNQDSILNLAHARLVTNRVRKLIWKYAREVLIFDKGTDAIINRFARKLDFDLNKLVGKELIDYRLENKTTTSDQDQGYVRYLVGIKIPNIMREIIVDLTVFKSDVNLAERLAA